MFIWRNNTSMFSPDSYPLYAYTRFIALCSPLFEQWALNPVIKWLVVPEIVMALLSQKDYLAWSVSILVHVIYSRVKPYVNFRH